MQKQHANIMESSWRSSKNTSLSPKTKTKQKRQNDSQSSINIDKNFNPLS
jgi:hypothetical protein